MQFSKAELRVLSSIGISAGQVSFAALFALLFQVDKANAILVLLSLLVTLFFWGGSWYLTRKFKL